LRRTFFGVAAQVFDVGQPLLAAVPAAITGLLHEGSEAGNPSVDDLAPIDAFEALKDAPECLRVAVATRAPLIILAGGLQTQTGDVSTCIERCHRSVIVAAKA